jgi:hypothetical protein|nr:MAG TPA: hypothetical protein [Caudoviricetes sp.]
MPEEYISREAALEITTRTCGDYAAAFAEIRKLPAADVAEVCFPAELHVGDRAWKKAMSILDKKYAEAKKLPFVRDPLAWALYHTWKEFDDGKRCD